MDNTLNQFRRRLAQINGIKLDEARSQYATHDTMTKNSLGQLWDKHFQRELNAAPPSDELERNVKHYHGPEAARDMKRHTNLLAASMGMSPAYRLDALTQARELRDKHNIPHDIFESVQMEQINGIKLDEAKETPEHLTPEYAAKTKQLQKAFKEHTKKMKEAKEIARQAAMNHNDARIALLDHLRKDPEHAELQRQHYNKYGYSLLPGDKPGQHGTLDHKEPTKDYSAMMGKYDK